jgi:hypothetical protein
MSRSEFSGLAATCKAAKAAAPEEIPPSMPSSLVLFFLLSIKLSCLVAQILQRDRI